MSSVDSDIIKRILVDALENCCPKLTRDTAIQSARYGAEITHTEDVGHVMLTVSGIEFCAITFLHYQRGENAKNSYLVLHETERTEVTEKDWEPFYTEMGNHLCGKIKKYFHHKFEYLGMSTPWILSSTTDLVDLTAHHLIASGQTFYTYNNIPIIGASLYVYSSSQLDFHTPVTDSSEHSNSGELEFF